MKTENDILKISYADVDKIKKIWEKTETIEESNLSIQKKLMMLEDEIDRALKEVAIIKNKIIDSMPGREFSS